MVASKTSETTEAQEESKEPEDIEPIQRTPDMTTVFEQAEAMQKELNAKAVSSMEDSIKQLYAHSMPAVELALAVLAESVHLKNSAGEKAA